MAARILNGFFSIVAQAVGQISASSLEIIAPIPKVIDLDNILSMIVAGWLDVHPRYLLLPRASPQDQHLVRRHHRITLSRPRHRSLHDPICFLAQRLLGEYWSDRALLAPHHLRHGRNDLQPSYSTFRATCPQEQVAEAGWDRAVAKSRAETDVLPGDYETTGCVWEGACDVVYGVLFSELCVDYRGQCYDLDLADRVLQVYAL